MKPVTKYLYSMLGVMLLLVSAVSVQAQDPARLNFERLAGLESKARDVVEVNIDGKLLELAKRVTVKVDDPEAQKVGLAIAGLKGVYVRVYNFDKDGEYNMADVDEIRAQLNSPGWERLANVRSKRNNQKVDVFTMFTGQVMSGIAVVISDSKTVALVNVIGPVDIETLVELSGRMNIPKIDIEREQPSKPKD